MAVHVAAQAVTQTRAGADFLALVVALVHALAAHRGDFLADGVGLHDRPLFDRRHALAHGLHDRLHFVNVFPDGAGALLLDLLAAVGRVGLDALLGLAGRPGTLIRFGHPFLDAHGAITRGVAVGGDSRSWRGGGRGLGAFLGANGKRNRGGQDASQQARANFLPNHDFS